MYRTYKTEEPLSNKKNIFEERLIPKEVINEPVKICSNESEISEIKSAHPLSGLFGNLFDNIEFDDILILGILMLLFYEKCEDNILIIILVALLFIR